MSISSIVSSTAHTSSGSFKLNNVLHVPHISSNLLSVHQFSKDNNCVFIFDSCGFIIQDRRSKRILFQGRSKIGLYPFTSSSSSSPSTAPTVHIGERSSVNVWHQRLGHPSASSLQHIMKALPINGSSSLSFCEQCQFGKSHKLPFLHSVFASSRPLELVHSDVWGPSPIVSVSGFRYYLVFVDDFSKYTWFFPLVYKSNVFYTFLHFKFQIEKMLASSIKCLRINGGGEFMNAQFCRFLTTNGISHQVSCPHTPEQNGCAERKHRHIVETGLTLLFQTSLPPKY